MTELLEYRFPPDPGHLRALRKVVREGTLGLGVTERRVELLVLAMDEIVSNSIEHGSSYRDSKDQLLVRVQLSGQDLQFDFYDPGVPDDMVVQMAEWLASSENGLPDLESERGRGFFLMFTSLDEVKIEPAADGGMHMRGRMTGVFD